MKLDKIMLATRENRKKKWGISDVWFGLVWFLMKGGITESRAVAIPLVREDKR